jgi:hypothetical protein
MEFLPIVDQIHFAIALKNNNSISLPITIDELITGITIWLKHEHSEASVICADNKRIPVDELTIIIDKAATIIIKKPVIEMKSPEDRIALASGYANAIMSFMGCMPPFDPHEFFTRHAAYQSIRERLASPRYFEVEMHAIDVRIVATALWTPRVNHNSITSNRGPVDFYKKVGETFLIPFGEAVLISETRGIANY